MYMTGVQKAATLASRECVAHRCRQLGREVTRLYDEALRENDLTVAQFSLLGAIALLEPIQAVELGRTLGIEKSTLSRNLKRLKQAGWAARLEKGGKTGLVLTGAGQQVFLNAFPAWQNAQAAVRRKLGKNAATTLDQLIAGLRKEI